MMFGDLSNKVGPAIVINADLLVEVKKKWFGLRYEINFLLSTRTLLEQWFRDGDLSIYIVTMGKLAKYTEKIEDLLDTFIVPYTRIIEIREPSALNYLVEAEHVIGYFYNMSTMVNERTNVRKHYKVPNISEVSYILSGGEINEQRY